MIEPVEHIARMVPYGLPHCLRATIGDEPAMDRVAETLINLRKGAR